MQSGLAYLEQSDTTMMDDAQAAATRLRFSGTSGLPCTPGLPDQGHLSTTGYVLPSPGPGLQTLLQHALLQSAYEAVMLSVCRCSARPKERSKQ